MLDIRDCANTMKCACILTGRYVVKSNYNYIFLKSRTLVVMLSQPLMVYIIVSMSLTLIPEVGCKMDKETQSLERKTHLSGCQLHIGTMGRSNYKRFKYLLCHVRRAGSWLIAKSMCIYIYIYIAHVCLYIYILCIHGGTLSLATQ